MRKIAMMGLALAILAGISTIVGRAYGRTAQTASLSEVREEPFVVEYYYKAKWGYAEEFLTLFKKNHYPVLLREMQMGRILRVNVMTPRLHATEDGRWDYRVTIVFKSAAVANDNFDSQSLLRQMFPDQDTYKKEEQRRFEILEGHWDVPVKDVVVDKH